MDDKLTETNNVQIDGLTEKKAREFKELLGKFVKSYGAKEPAVSDKEWLAVQFKQELPSLSAEQAKAMASETLDTISVYDKDLADLNAACAKGESKENWFAEHVADAATGASVVQMGNYLNSVDSAISIANNQMLQMVTTEAGNVSQQWNLDGFIAEQHMVNQFNARAALSESPFVAEAMGSNAANSFDTVIRDTATGKIEHQYQIKFGGTAEKTIRLLRDGNYDNQRIVVPAEQVEEVAKAFPGKSVTAYMGGTDKVPIKTDGLTKQQVKELQLGVQEDGVLPTTDWNSFTTKELALNLGKHVAQAGVQAAAITVGFDLAAKIMSGEKIDADKTVEAALTTAADTGLKAATAGAMKVGVEKGILSVIPKGTPIGILTNIACVGIENAKILLRVAKGDITMSQAMEQMGRTTTSMVGGIMAAGKGALIGATALSWIPVVGPIVGGVAGGMIGYFAGSKVGELIYSASKTVRTAAKNIMHSTMEGLKSVGRSIKQGLKNFFG